MLAKNDMLDW